MAGIYNLIFVLQITRPLLGDAIISSKTDTRNGTKKERKSFENFEKKFI